LIVAIVGQILRQQRPDGGWGAADVTGAVLEAVATANCEQARPALERAHEFLRASQQADGSWTNSCGMEQVHATSAAVCGLLAAGVSNDDDTIAAGLNWLAVNPPWSPQRKQGYFESHLERTDDTYSEHQITCVSTTNIARALLAFVAAGKPNHAVALRAVDILVETQNDRGGWNDPNSVLHDAAADRWFHHDLHAVAWPLLALSRWAVAAASAQSATADTMTLRLVPATSDN
jgi:squalene-hopene/tetraprenyl-beta-curcumene cyclase